MINDVNLYYGPTKYHNLLPLPVIHSGCLTLSCHSLIVKSQTCISNHYNHKPDETYLVLDGISGVPCVIGTVTDGLADISYLIRQVTNGISGVTCVMSQVTDGFVEVTCVTSPVPNRFAEVTCVTGQKPDDLSHVSCVTDQETDVSAGISQVTSRVTNGSSKNTFVLYLGGLCNLLQGGTNNKCLSDFLYNYSLKLFANESYS